MYTDEVNRDVGRILVSDKTFDASIVSEKPLLEMSDSGILPTAKKNRSRRIEARSVGFAHDNVG